MKCARTGCHQPRQIPDRDGLALCAEHTRQFHNGTIGTDHNPRSRETAIEHAQHLIQLIAQPGDTLRDLEAKTGLCKDTIHNIIRGKHKRLRSESWELLQEAVATHIYEQNLKEETWANLTKSDGGTS